MSRNLAPETLPKYSDTADTLSFQVGSLPVRMPLPEDSTNESKEAKHRIIPRGTVKRVLGEHPRDLR